ncbi:MAG: hypothetical protein AB7O04_11520, partial [Hyphomonadaceae bacterium]
MAAALAWAPLDAHAMALEQPVAAEALPNLQPLPGEVRAATEATATDYVIDPAIGAVVLREQQIRLVASTIYAEARSEGPRGMRAVAHVSLNRLGPRFGETL